LINVVAKLLSLLLLNKIFAAYFGPSGYALIGQFQNVFQLTTNLSGASLGVGVTKYTAEKQNDQFYCNSVWSTAFILVIALSILFSFLVIVFGDFFALHVFGSSDHSLLFVLMSFGIIFFSLNAIILSIFNGKNDIKAYVAISIASSIVTLFLGLLLTVKFGLYGALAAFPVSYALIFFISVFIINKKSWFNMSELKSSVNNQQVNRLLKFSLMALITGILIPVTQILVRNHLGETFGWESAGLWEGVWRLSGVFMLLITTTLSLYYLPVLSSIKSKDKILIEIRNGYATILPFALFFYVVIYFLQYHIVRLFLTEDFTGIHDIFGWQLAGDFLKVGSWLIAYLMVAKAMIREYIFCEILFAVSFYSLVIMITDIYGLVGATMAYCISYAIYWIVVLVMMNKRFHKVMEYE
jgi:PST family polysaccharide transporter